MIIPEATYQVTCSCGQSLNGTRQASFQVVRCPSCGGDRFILPRSPFSPIAGKAAPSPHPSPIWGPSHKVWLFPALATAITAAVLLAVYLIFLKPEKPKEDGLQGNEPAQERLARAERYISEGSFQLAANALASSRGESLSGRESRRWQQLYREASLLADLSAEPIEDILRHAGGVSEQEWKAAFPRRYQGKAFLFDIHVQRLPTGRVQADYVLPGPDPARLEWGDLEVLRTTDLDESRRIILGVRLAGIALEPPGPSWVVRFQPQSGVFLTDAEAAALCCPPLGKPEAQAILKKQAQMVGER